MTTAGKVAVVGVLHLVIAAGDQYWGKVAGPPSLSLLLQHPQEGPKAPKAQGMCVAVTHAAFLFERYEQARQVSRCENTPPYIK